MCFTHIFLFTVTSKSSIDINAISHIYIGQYLYLIINNVLTQGINHKYMKIIIQLFVNNVACFTA